MYFGLVLLFCVYTSPHGPRCLGLSLKLYYCLKWLDSSTNGTTGFRYPQALSSALAALGTLQPRAFGFLNPIVPWSRSLNYIQKTMMASTVIGSLDKMLHCKGTLKHYTMANSWWGSVTLVDIYFIFDSQNMLTQ